MKTLKKIFQIFFLAWFMILSIGKKFNLSWGENGHGICPMGGIETLHTYITTGKFVKETGANNAVMLVALFMTLVVGGAFFCGWICPWGTLQEYISSLGKKNNKFFRKIPSRLEILLGYFKYLVLFIIIIQTANLFKLVFEGYDPFYTLSIIGSSEISISGYMILIIALLGSFFTERAFCRYACPLGAINGIFNRISFFKIKRDKTLCAGCGACDNVCSMNIKISEEEIIKSASCNRCLECIEVCPINSEKKNVLNLVNFSKFQNNGHIFPKLMGAIFITPIIIGILTGKFYEEKIRNFMSPDDIRGSYSIMEIIQNYNITQEEFYHIYGLKKNYNPDLKIKELGDKNITIDNIRNIITNLDKKPVEIKEEHNKSFLNNNNETLRTQIFNTRPGDIGKIFVTSTMKEEPIIKRSTLLIEIKDIVEDFDAFLVYFRIDADELPNTSISELEQKYEIKLKNVKEYIMQNRR